MRILVDYRPALRERTGVGEYVHELVRAYTALPEAAADEVSLFTSSWKDRPADGLGAALNVSVVDRRVPVSVLNYLWHRREWPPVETLAGRIDVVHSQHPLLIPARRAAQVITIHDLFFLSAPERTRGEIRRDYPALAAAHARRADAIVVSSDYTAGLVAERLGVSGDRIYVCPAGAPTWLAPDGRGAGAGPRYVLFLGTLEPRKNLGVLLDAYASLLARNVPVPRLVLAGRHVPAMLDVAGKRRALRALQPRRSLGRRTAREHRGYVAAGDRAALYAGACLLVMPSLDEGFGLPVLEAMAAGVPVVASRRGSLPEVAGDAAVLVDATDVEGFAQAMERVVREQPHAQDLAARGVARAAHFSWAKAAAAARRAYVDAVARRRERA